MKRLLVPLLLAAAAMASAESRAPAKVEGAWARPIVPGQQSSGAYMTIIANEPLTLLGAETPAAGIVEIHQMKMEGDIMKMRAADKVPIAPGKPLHLSPGGFHFMLMDLHDPFKAGTRIPMTLQLRDAKGKVTAVPVSVPVQATPPAKPARE